MWTDQQFGLTDHGTSITQGRFSWSVGPNFDLSNQIAIDTNGQSLAERTKVVRWTREQV